MNHLKHESSPYLKQHATNPVEWFPWGEEAFLKAEQENKPVFLSIGYSTCHWCHVMAHESFEDEKVADMLNNDFVSIKVDREERPDIDKMYMTVCQLLTGQGGWPLTIMMTPDKRPFFAATYLPKESRYGIRGLIPLINEVKNLWRTNPEKLVHSAEAITSNLKKIRQGEGGVLSEKIIDDTYEQLFHAFDEQYGGFNNHPKFPSPHNLLFLTRYWKQKKEGYARQMVDQTLEQMRLGGIYDHIGFGFHRYATDRKWMVPHFEKMLYDQALLLIAYVEAYQATKTMLFKKTADEIIQYVFTSMTAENGGFFSAEDADTADGEGVFYTWSYDELKQVLSSEEFKRFSTLFSIERQGNFVSETGHVQNRNILHQQMTLEEYADIKGLDLTRVRQQIHEIRMKLYEIREKRLHPGKDEKILTDWNGLMIAALAKAGRILENDESIKHAEKACDFILGTMKTDDGGLFHRFKDEQAGIKAYADDYAFFIWGLIELYQTTFKVRYLEKALEFNQYLLDHFWDNQHGGFFFTEESDKQLLVRMKDAYDGAYPSANSVAIHNLISLSRITGDVTLETKAEMIGVAFSKQINNNPLGYTHLASGLMMSVGPSFEIIVVGDRKRPDTKKIITYLHSLYLPNNVVIVINPLKNNTVLQRLVPSIDQYEQIDEKPTIYICKDRKCHPPITDIDDVHTIIEH